MPNYPDYVRRKLAEARDVGQWYAAQADGAAICFAILADFPDCVEASELVYELFCDEWLIYDNRVALQRQIDEWDDRPSEQRRRLAHSYKYLSRRRWERAETEADADADADKEGVPFEDEDAALTRAESPETKHLLSEGKMQLVEAYCLGDEEATEYAFPCFMRALEIARDPQPIRYAIAEQYADLGFFADAVEFLLEYLAHGDSRAARRLLAEAQWWRDNGYRIPWVPPPGDGSRYDRLIKLIDPEAPTQQEYMDYVRAHRESIGKTPTWEPVITPELKALFGAAIPTEPPPPAPALVDWSFLDREDGSSTEIADWVYKDIRLFGKRRKDFEAYMLQMHKLTRPIPPPTVPKKYNPRELEMSEEDFDAEMDDEFWEDMDDEPDDENAA